MINDWEHDADPHGVIPKGWVLPGQYKVVCFLSPSGVSVLSLMVGIKYKNCVGRYSTTLSYISVLRDYFLNVDLAEINKFAWRSRFSEIDL